jgi:hypothetical protein
MPKRHLTNCFVPWEREKSVSTEKVFLVRPIFIVAIACFSIEATFSFKRYEVRTATNQFRADDTTSAGK